MGVEASFNEKLLLSNGLSISPLKTDLKPSARSLREIVTAIDNEKDLNSYLGGFHSKVPPRSGEPKYDRHPVSASRAGRNGNGRTTVLTPWYRFSTRTTTNPSLLCSPRRCRAPFRHR